MMETMQGGSHILKPRTRSEPAGNASVWGSAGERESDPLPRDWGVCGWGSPSLLPSYGFPYRAQLAQSKQQKVGYPSGISVVRMGTLLRRDRDGDLVSPSLRGVPREGASRRGREVRQGLLLSPVPQSCMPACLHNCTHCKPRPPPSTLAPRGAWVDIIL